MGVPEPDAYVAVRAGAVFRASVGAPATVTGSLKVSWTWIVAPAAYEPSALEAETDEIVAAVVSTTRLLFAASEPEAPGVGSTSEASFVAASRIVPPLRMRAAIDA